jgi:hypothetical protein
VKHGHAFVVQISTAAATIPTVWRRHHGGFWLLVVQISTVVFGYSNFRWFLVPISTAATAAVSFFLVRKNDSEK